MTLSSGWDETEKADVATFIPGYTENSTTGGKAANSAIPTFFDSWFHGDYRQSPPLSRSAGFGRKMLEEYERMFPNYRVKTSVEIGFDTDGETISSFEVEMAEPSRLAPITLEGGPPDEPHNPFRTEFDFDGEDDYLPANQKGPKTTHETVTVDGVEGVRGSIIYGGNDTYLSRVKNKAIEGLEDLTPANIPEEAMKYFISLPAFYAFVDFVFMADGTKVLRVWDTSFYPAHALYVDGDRQDQTPFDEGEAWTRDGFNRAFDTFALESVTPGRTPFNNLFGSFVYKRKFDAGAGKNPTMIYRMGGSSLLPSTVENNLSSPLFPL